jgi:TolB protein
MSSTRDSNPSWSPDGRWLAFDRSGTLGGLLVARADRAGSPVRLAAPGSCTDPAWSPSGDKIACADTRRGRAGIVVIAIPGGERRRLTHDPGGGDRSPAWAPDGSAVAFARLGLSGSQLWIVRADGSGARPLERAGDTAGSPAWSPGGRTIAFSDRRGLGLVSADGTTVRVLVDRKAFDPGWSPDGRYVAFWAVSGTAARLWAVDVRTGRVMRLPSPGVADAVSPAWEPLPPHGGPWAVDRGDAVSRWLAARYRSGLQTGSVADLAQP